MRDHAACRVGSLASRLALLDEQDAQVFLLQAPRQREANHSRTNNDRVPRLHASIVWEGRGADGPQAARIAAQSLITNCYIVVLYCCTSPPKEDHLAKKFRELSEREILALAISLEEEDARIYADYADGLRDEYPDTAKLFDEMRAEETEHRNSLMQTYQARFGDHIPLIRRNDVKGFVQRRPVWLARPLRIADVRKQVEVMEYETRRFYERAIHRSPTSESASCWATWPRSNAATTPSPNTCRKRSPPAVGQKEEDAQRRLFMLQIVQPGLAGLMDGSVSTLAPVFAAAFATKSSWDAFLVGLAASVGAGISMAFAEALSDDGSLTGRGRPTLRGAVTGLMTAAGGIGHTLPFLIADFRVAFSLAVIVVAIELAVISYIRHRYMDTPILSAAFQVVLGGALVFATGILIGSS